MAEIPLRKRGGAIVTYTIVDDADADVLNVHRWHLASNGYAARGIRPDGGPSRQQLMHRQLLGLERGDPRLGDHINGNTLDNRRGNLRIATHAGNSQNRRPISRSGVRGVTWNKSCRKWQASVKLDDRNYYLGVFEDKDEAGRVAAAFRALHMPFAVDRVAA